MNSRRVINASLEILLELRSSYLSQAAAPRLKPASRHEEREVRSLFQRKIGSCARPCKDPARIRGRRKTMRRDIFTEEHEMFRAQVARFVDAEIAPKVEEWNRVGM